MAVDYREEPCRTALNRVSGMPFAWSLNPYMGCAHRCTFCYVRAFEQRADRPSDDRYGRSIRVKINVVEVLRRELARQALGARGRRDRRRDGSVPAGGGPLPADAGLHRGARGGPQPVRDHHPRPDDRPRRRRARRGVAPCRRLGHVLGPDARPTRSGGPRSPAPRRRGSGCGRCARSSTPGSTPASGWPRSCPGCRTGRSCWRDVVKAARDAGATVDLDERPYLRPGTREHFLENLARDWPELLPRYERLYAGRAYLGKKEIEPVRREVADLRDRFEVGDRRTVRLLPSLPDAQLELAAAGRPASRERRGSDRLSAVGPRILELDGPPALPQDPARRAPLPSRRRGDAGDHVGHRPRPGHQAPDEATTGSSATRSPCRAKRARSFDGYLQLFHWTELIQSSPIAVERAVYEVVGGAYRKNNVTTMELRFNPMKRNRGGEQDLDHIIAAAVAGHGPGDPRVPGQAGPDLLPRPGVPVRAQRDHRRRRRSPGATGASSASTSPAPSRRPSASPTTGGSSGGPASSASGSRSTPARPARSTRSPGSSSCSSPTGSATA